MKQGLYVINENTLIADKTFRLVLQGDTSSLSEGRYAGSLPVGGQFAGIALQGRFLRRPLAVTKWDDKTMTLIYKVVGQGTEQLSKMRCGESLDVLTALGNGFDATACKEAAIIVCGGIGASPVYTLCSSLIASGRKVTVVMGFNTASEIVLEDDFRAMGADVHVATMDGSYGYKGLVTELIAYLAPEYDHFFTCGPKVMMKAVCEALPTSGQASLEERMGCGCGICYGCTCNTKEGPRRICADGPVFYKENIIW